MASSDDDKKDKRISKMQPNLVKLLDCPVCFERITPPVTVCNNGHAVCNKCRQKLELCPTCKGGFSTNRNTILDQIIEENIFGCKYAFKGCTVEMKLRELEEHENKYCIFRGITCTILNERSEICAKEVSVCDYYAHVNSHHKSSVEMADFSLETKRTVDTSWGSHVVRILKDVKSGKIVFELVRIDTVIKKFYITYVYVGTQEETNKMGYELRISNPKEKFRELKYKSLCVPLGATETDMEESERCLVLHTSILGNFTSNEHLTYSVKFENVSQKWYKKVGKKITQGLMDEENSTNECKHSLQHCRIRLAWQSSKTICGFGKPTANDTFPF